MVNMTVSELANANWQIAAVVHAVLSPLEADKFFTGRAKADNFQTFRKSGMPILDPEINLRSTFCVTFVTFCNTPLPSLPAARTASRRRIRSGSGKCKWLQTDRANDSFAAMFPDLPIPVTILLGACICRREWTMVITFEAIYEDGVLRTEKPLPLAERERVQVTVQPKRSVAQESAGMLPWHGDWETLRRIAEDDEFGVMESPWPSMIWSRRLMSFSMPTRSSTTSPVIRIGGAACTRLLERIELQEFRGVTSTHVLAGVTHRLMTIEAMDRLGWPATRLAARLRKHHAEIPNFTVYAQALVKIAQMGVQVLPVLEQHVIQASQLSRALELLTGDALVTAVMQAHCLTQLASKDDDFDRVPGITRYAPAWHGRMEMVPAAQFGEINERAPPSADRIR
jgi:predicted nucleic acid-binding protein/predicted DNA-binding antitoxin AbrB/MazE fold protein